MRINSNSGINAYRNYSNNLISVGRSTEKLSTGYSVNRSADNAAALAISEGMRTQITGYSTELNNVKNQISAAQTADGALTEVHSTLNRMQELAARASGGIYTDEQRGMLQNEFAQLSSEMNRIYDSASFNGNALLKDRPDLSGVNLSTAEGASAALKTISGAIDQVSGQRSDYGTLQNGLEHTANSLYTSAVNTQASESLIRDTDIAEQVMKNTKDKILLQFSQALMAQANQNAGGVLRLLNQ